MGEFVLAIDTHAHVWTSASALAPGRRYTPSRTATIKDYLKILDEHEISHAVLVQPSFLDDDNQALLQALTKYPDRLRGVAVIPANASTQRLSQLSEFGVVGIRLNLIGQQRPIVFDDGFNSLAAWIRANDWHVEVQAQGSQWLDVMPVLMEAGCKVVIDHFGRPDPALGLDCPGFKKVLEAGHTGRSWIKFSAPYRCVNSIVPTLCRSLMENYGNDHIIWGSDYPWTQNENRYDYPTAIRDLYNWLPTEFDQSKVLIDNPRKLYRF